MMPYPEFVAAEEKAQYEQQYREYRKNQQEKLMALEVLLSSPGWAYMKEEMERVERAAYQAMGTCPVAEQPKHVASYLVARDFASWPEREMKVTRAMLQQQKEEQSTP